MYEFIDNTAEAGFRIEADTLEELAEDAVRALGSLMAENCSGSGEREVSIDFSDPSIGLYELLDELVYLKDVEQLVFMDAKAYLDGSMMKIMLHGSKIEDCDALKDVKSPTFHNLNVRKNGKWKAEVVVDI